MASLLSNAKYFIKSFQKPKAAAPKPVLQTRAPAVSKPVAQTKAVNQTKAPTQSKAINYTPVPAKTTTVNKSSNKSSKKESPKKDVIGGMLDSVLPKAYADDGTTPVSTGGTISGNAPAGSPRVSASGSGSGLRAGVWGTPELGITEGIGSLLGKGSSSNPSLSGENYMKTYGLGGGSISLTPAGEELYSTTYGSNPNKLSQAGYLNNMLGQYGTGGAGDILGDSDYRGGGSLSGVAQDLSQSEIDQINTQYDRLISEGQTGLDDLDLQNQANMDEQARLEQELLSNVNAGKLSAEETAQAEQDKALSTAKQSERRTRNTLRALGILGSSAGGDLMSRVWNTYDEQKNAIGNGLVKRKQELDTYFTQKNDELSRQAQSIRQAYQNKVNQIKRDIRFTSEDRTNAINAANTALRAKMAELNAAAQQNSEEADVSLSEIEQALKDVMAS